MTTAPATTGLLQAWSVLASYDVEGPCAGRITGDMFAVEISKPQRHNPGGGLTV